LRITLIVYLFIDAVESGEQKLTFNHDVGEVSETITTAVW